MSKKTARLDWSLWIECPACKEDIDLASGKHDEDHGIAHAIFNNRWDDLVGYDVMCEECECDFQIKDIEH